MQAPLSVDSGQMGHLSFKIAPDMYVLDNANLGVKGIMTLQEILPYFLLTCEKTVERLVVELLHP